MLEQMDDGPFTARQVKYFTARDSCLPQVLTYGQNGWLDQVQDDHIFTAEQNCHHMMVAYCGDIAWLSHHKAEQLITWGTLRYHPNERGAVWWPKLDKEIETMVRSCSKCQVQQDNPPTAPLIPWNWPTRTTY